MFDVLCATMLFVSVGAVEYSETNEGYAQGLMPICPGIKKPADIKPEHLNQIKISVLGNGSLTQAKWTSYTYRNVRSLAKNPDVDFHRRTIVYTPAYMDSTALPLGRLMLVLYKKLGYNVLILDYVQFTTNAFPVVVRLGRPIGKHVAEMLAKLTTVGLDPKKLDLVGLSLGAVTMSFIAKNFRQITGRNVSSITALDPTGPCLRYAQPEDRLDPSDADFVLSVASNIAGYGTATPVGHVTIFLNGGEFQTGVITSVICGDICSHFQPLFIWMSALEHPGSFIAMKCDSEQQARDHQCFERMPMETNTLDLFTDRSKPGIFYLATSHHYPFYLGEKGLKRSGATILNHISSLNDVDVLRV